MTKHADTLAAILTSPTQTNLDWRDIEAMLDYYGAEISTGSGARIRVCLSGVKAVLHRPDTAGPVTRPMVRSLARFLRTAGVEV